MKQSSKDKLVGTWVQVSLDTVSADGTRRPLYGENAKGMIIYTSDGYFTLMQASVDLPKLKSGLTDTQLKHLDGLGVAHRDDPAAFDFFHLLLREPLVGPLLERPSGRLPVLVELLLGARVFAFLEQVLGLVAVRLMPHWSDRPRMGQLGFEAALFGRAMPAKKRLPLRHFGGDEGIRCLGSGVFRDRFRN